MAGLALINRCAELEHQLADAKAEVLEYQKHIRAVARAMDTDIVKMEELPKLLASAIERNRRFDAMVARAEAAEAIVAKLPKTADGVPAYPSMYVYSPHPLSGELDRLTVYMDANNEEWQNGKEDDFSACWSTREAAIAAQAKPEGKP